MTDNFKFPTLSGDFDSTEITETQAEILDLLKGAGKLSLIASKSRAKYKVEKVQGLERFLFQVNKLQNENPEKITREAIEKLEQDVRYEEREDEIGNKTEFLRLLLSELNQNSHFKELMTKLVEEQQDLARKRSDNRHFAEKAQSEDLGL